MAVTAWPVILVDSAAGSDIAASGAGPSTALTGTAAATDVGGTIVTLDSGIDLTNVSIDGSHVIYFVDTTAGHRMFSAINAKAGSGGATPTVTVEQAFTGSLSGKTWAIGGKRASVGGTNSVKLLENNSSSGDAMPGWVVEMQSGHSETVAATITMRRAGDTTNGNIVLRGVSGAATIPLLTFSNNGTAINTGVLAPAYQTVKDFELRNSNATKTASIAILIGGDITIIRGIKISHSTNKFFKGITTNNNNTNEILDCEVGYTASHGISLSGSNGRAYWCYVHDCGGIGINFDGSSTGGIAYGNIVYNCTSQGIYANRDLYCWHNTVDSCGSDGFRFDFVNPHIVVNNLVSNNLGYGFNFNNALSVDNYIIGRILMKGNNTYNNTSGAYKSNTGTYAYNTCPWASGDSGLNPNFTNAAAGDFSIGINLKAQGYPLAGSLYVGKTSITYNFIDPGATQRRELPNPGSLILQASGMI